jgi:polysaccharide export outer membrane protein
MKLKSLLAYLFVLLLSAGAIAQTSDQLDALKQNLTPEEQQAILQGVTGQGTGSTTKSDPRLNMPQTVQPKNGDRTGFEQFPKERKTADGHTLRQANEDLQLRADDSVLIELVPLYDLRTGVPCNYQSNSNNNNGYNENGDRNASNCNNNNGINGTTGNNGNRGLTNNGVDLNALASGNANGNPSLNGNNSQRNNQNNQPVARKQLYGKAKTEAERDRLEKFRKRILSSNPYRLNRFGVLEIPGLPSIPMAGLTAEEATERLNADPDLADFDVKLTLLRLEPFGQEALKPFGYDLFEGAPSTFAPVSDIQVPLDYVIGPGDRLDIQLYGNEPSSYKLTVERDGRILFPKLGPIVVGDLTFAQAQATIEQRVSQQLIGTRVSISMGDLRSIRVFVLGEAEKPGSYTVSGLSTMTNALFVSGGVKKIGSLRNIELKRDGRLVSVLDLYDLLLHGDTSGDRKLLPGDVIFIPPIGNTVAVGGSVRRPAIYETKEEKTVAQAIALAGGLLPDADPKLVQVERIMPDRLRQMLNVDLMQPRSAAMGLLNGDKVLVQQIRPTLENSVTLSGYVFRPGKFEYRAGLRLTDILGNFDELRPDADAHYIMIRRVVPPEERITVVSADLPKALAARGSAADPELRPRDEIMVFDLSASRERILEPILRTLELQATPEQPEQIVSIDGRVKAPGRYPLEPTMHVSDLIRAGGSMEDSAYRGDAELTRYEVVNGLARKTDLIPINLAAIRRGEKAADLDLRPYDVLVIKPIVQWQEPGDIEMLGEVRFPGKYPIHQGETLYSVLQRAGGLTDVAFPYGAVFLREELKKREKDQLELLANRLQGDLAALSLEAVASSSVSGAGGGSAGAAQSLAIGSQLLDQLRSTKPVGRLVIDVNRVLKGPAGATGDVLVKDGDKLMVPKKTQEVTILGEVQSPTSHVFQPGLTRDDYIARSGGVTQKADRKRIYVVRANGDVISGERRGWFRRSRSIEMRPGDTIVVPLDTERVRALPLWQAVTTIIYNLAVAFLAVHNT